MEKDSREQRDENVMPVGSPLPEGDDLARIFAMSIDLICIADINSTMFLKVNPAFTETLGFSEAELLSKSFLEFIHPDDVEPTKQIVEEKLKAGAKVINFENRYRCKDGSYRWLSWVSQPVPERGVTYAVARDVTSVKKTEKRLRESEKRYRELFHRTERYFNISAAILVVLDNRGHIMEINESGCRFLGVEKADLINKNWFDRFIPEAYRDEAKTVFTSLVVGNIEPIEYYENMIVARGNQNRLIAWRNTTIYNDDGQMTGILCSGEDITEKKNLEREVRQRQKIEAIGNLSGGIAHEFNNVLGIIIGNTELGIDELESDHPVREYFEEIMSAGLRARDVVKQLLNFSRKMDVQKVPVYLPVAIRGITKLLKASISSTIEIRVVEESPVYQVVADVTQIHQVLLNLFNNAVHAMAKDGGTLTISLKNFSLGPGDSLRTLSAGDYVHLMVSDEGVGIPPKHIDRVFDPYFTTKEVGEGTGMGLSVAHGIVRSHNGEITVESTPGKGATFHIYLPALKEAVLFEASDLSENLPTGTERILFVDDEVSLGSAAEKLLKGLGYDVHVACDPLKALDLFRENPGGWDLIISDMTMPGMTGDRLAEEIFAIRPGIPFALCSGYSDRIAPQALKESGIRTILTKPVTRAVFAEAVRNALD